MIASRRETVELFFSFRSPYSYLAAPRVFRLAERFRVGVRFRGVLPMVEREETLHRDKVLHLIRDARREARHLGMPFGPMCDPIGDGVRNCLAIAERAQELGMDVGALVMRLGRGIWAEAADVSRHRVLARLVGAAGLDWSRLEPALHDDSIDEVLAANRQALTSAGHWGVPTMVFRDEPFWGQDRIDDLELALAAA
ncbi:MAG: DsbA family protein, partial [Deltaproteobacteria bacterium]|nr:DsbA family protein [Deltaproteobacteria bacterium]